LADTIGFERDEAQAHDDVEEEASRRRRPVAVRRWMANPSADSSISTATPGWRRALGDKDVKAISEAFRTQNMLMMRKSVARTSTRGRRG